VLLFDLGTAPDLLRLLAVPVFGWAALRDARTRRVPNETWYPLVAVGVVALGWDLWAAAPAARSLLLLRTGVSLGLVVPIAYGLWWLGGFGGADTKALMTVAVLLPVYPTYYLPTVALPVVSSAAGVFSLTVLANGVLLGAAYPLAVAARNLLRGRLSRAALVGVPVRVSALPATHGRLLETPEGFTRAGLDLDALRMYLRWRGIDLADLLADPALRDPDTVAETGDPTDGAVRTDGGSDADAPPGADQGDPWAAERFLAETESGAYGTTPATLRDGLDRLAGADPDETVWVSPGIPFILPLFVGLVVSLTAGDLLVAALSAVAA
jgi:preflagellin peptidase FlaK